MAYINVHLTSFGGFSSSLYQEAVRGSRPLSNGLPQLIAGIPSRGVRGRRPSLLLVRQCLFQGLAGFLYLIFSIQVFLETRLDRTLYPIPLPGVTQ